jgi:flagella synthesis protein FlgN
MGQATDTQNLSPLLTELLDLLSQFESVLETEADALKSSQLNNLTDTLQRKEQLSESVSETFQSLAQHLPDGVDLSSPLKESNLSSLPGLKAEDRQALQNISEKTKHCHKLNTINGMTVQSLRHLNQTTLNLLTGQENTKTYSASGKTVPSDQKSNPLGKA